MGPFIPTGYLLFILSLLAFIVMQRLLHREIQGFLLLVFTKPRIVMVLFSLILLPGVFLHELSHFLIAKIVGVPVTKFSIIPESSKDGTLRLGFVQTRQCDPVRDSLIGLAPFIFGLILIGLIGSRQLGMEAVVTAAFQSDTHTMVQAFQNSTHREDYWIWMYLAFSISSTMLPSVSDRQSWKTVIIGIVLILIGLLIFGLGGWLMEEVAPRIEQWVRIIAIVLASSTIIHLIIFLPLLIFRFIFSRLTGRQLVRV